MTTVYDHPDYLTQLAGIRAMPDDDVRRLVLADWLDEHGETERAEFIRLQVELAKWACPEQWMMPPFDTRNGKEMVRRQRELFDRYATTWFGGSWAILHCGRPTEDSTATMPDLGHAFVTRGFVSEYHGPMTRWCGVECPTCEGEGQHPVYDDDGTPGYFYTFCLNCEQSGRVTGIGRDLVTNQPVQVVRVTDREPFEGRGGGLGERVRVWGWCEDNSAYTGTCHLGDLWRRLPGEGLISTSSVFFKFYPTREVAMIALSTAALAWAKSPPALTPR